MKSFLHSSAIVILLTTTQAMAQPEVQWSRTFGGQECEEGFSVQQTADRGFIVVGRTESFGEGHRGYPDIYLVKTDENGEEEWSRTFGWLAWDIGFWVEQTTDGGFIVTGYTEWERDDEAEQDVWLIKTDAEGEVEWSRTFGGEGDDDVGYCVKQTADGSFIIVGRQNSLGEGADVFLIKTDDRGREEWSRTFGGRSDEVGYCVQQTIDGGFVIAGMTESFGENVYDVYLIKTDNEGQEEWSRTFGSERYNYGYSVQQTTDNGFIIVGTLDFQGGEMLDVYLIKTDAEGEEEWSRTFGEGGGNQNGRSVLQTADGGFVIAGSTDIPGGNRDAYLIKTNAAGEEEWSRSFGGQNSDFSNCVKQTDDEGFVIAGTTRSNERGNADVWLIRLGPDNFGLPSPFDLLEPADGDTLERGTVRFVWSASIDPNPEDTVSYALWLKAGEDSVSFTSDDTLHSVHLDSLALDPERPVIWWVKAISPLDTVESNGRFTLYIRSQSAYAERANPPWIYALLPPYPNPFNSITSISYILPFPSAVRLSIIDLSGREIAIIKDGFCPAGEHRTILNHPFIPPGLYLCHLEANGQNLTRRVVLIK